MAESELADVERVVGDSNRLVLVRNGVESAEPSPSQRADARAQLALKPSDIVGVYLGALDPHKDPLVVAHAALEVTKDGAPLVLLFAGDGPLRSAVEALGAGHSALRPIGFQTQPRRVLAAADFFVLPSLREGLSFSLLEAMASSLPVVVSDAPGNTDAVGDAGIVVPRGDVNGFASAFHQLLDSSKRSNLGHRAQARVRDRFAADQMKEATRAVYDSVLRLRAGSRSAAS